MRNVNTISFNFIVYLFVLFAAFFFFYISWIWRKCVLSVYLVISSMFCSNNTFKNYINYILNRSKMKELSVQVPCRQRWEKHSITEIIQWTPILKKTLIQVTWIQSELHFFKFCFHNNDLWSPYLWYNSTTGSQVLFRVFEVRFLNKWSVFSFYSFEL